MERVAREHGLWGQVPSEVARTLVVLALAERAWAGPDADTPITLTVEDRRVRLAVPTAAANASEREDRATANPRLRHLLVQCGDLPALPHGAIMDNDAVLAVLDEKYPGGRCDFESAVTWLSMPLVPEARVVPRVVAPFVRPASVAVQVPPQQVIAPREVADVQAPHAASPVRELTPGATPPISAVPTSAPASQPARPRRRFHPRSSTRARRQPRPRRPCRRRPLLHSQHLRQHRSPWLNLSPPSGRRPRRPSPRLRHPSCPRTRWAPCPSTSARPSFASCFAPVIDPSARARSPPTLASTATPCGTR